MDNTKNDDFDFDEWKTLAKSDPVLFNKKRDEAIQEVIASAPEHIQNRLRGLQWRIDIERSKHDTPLASCIHVFGMMWDSVYAKHGLLDALKALKASMTNHSEEVTRETLTLATILPFSSDQSDGKTRH